MKRISLVAGVTGVLLLILVASQALARPRNVDIKRAFMRQKLDCSKNILEGLVLERFDLVATNAIRLRNLSASNNWSLINYPDYVEYAKKFQADADLLFQAAIATNFADSVAAYHSVVNDCVVCHRENRSAQIKSKENP
jgi:hypothetical protein